MEIDFIGDVHGHADALEALLADLGWRHERGCWRHPDPARHAVFLGDLIDRGPDQLRSVDIPRRMRDAGVATVLMGNHELNAIGWAIEDPRRPGGCLRPHTGKNRAQHAVFLDQAGEGSRLYHELVSWMTTLPCYFELPGARAVHACWHPASIDLLRQASHGSGTLPFAALVETFNEGSALRDAAEKALKGLEIALPEGVSFIDAGGARRTNSRLRWWDLGEGTYESGAIGEEGMAGLPADPLPDEAFEAVPDPEAPPAFFGHYWMKGTPHIVAPKAACLDFSVAKDGFMCAYSWSGETELDPARLTYVAPATSPAP